LFTHEKIAVIVDQSRAVITTTSACKVARISLRRVGHPARALDWVPKRKKHDFYFFPFVLSDHPLALAVWRQSTNPHKKDSELQKERPVTDEAQGPYITIPQYRFNKTKQDTQTHTSYGGSVLPTKGGSRIQPNFGGFSSQKKLRRPHKVLYTHSHSSD